MSNTWMVRAGRGGENVEAFLKDGIVALAEPKLGAIPPSIKKDDLLHLYAERYPELKEASRASWASQLLRFIGELRIGDAVVTFDRGRRFYFLGTITSEYEWAPTLVEENPHVRRVQWTHQVPRDLLTVATRNTLGAILTLFKLGPDVAKDLRQHQSPIGTVVADLPPKTEELAAEEGEAEELVRAEMIEKADEFIEDAINAPDWKQLQDLVAGILRAMGRFGHSLAGGGRETSVCT